MNTNVFTMPAPNSTGGVWAFPSQLHPFVPPPSPGHGGGGMRLHSHTPVVLPPKKPTLDPRCRDEEDIAALIALGVL